MQVYSVVQVYRFVVQSSTKPYAYLLYDWPKCQVRNQGVSDWADDPLPSAKGAKGPLSFAGEKIFEHAMELISFYVTQSLYVFTAK